LVRFGGPPRLCLWVGPSKHHARACAAHARPEVGGDGVLSLCCGPCAGCGAHWTAKANERTSSTVVRCATAAAQALSAQARKPLRVLRSCSHATLMLLQAPGPMPRGGVEGSARDGPQLARRPATGGCRCAGTYSSSDSRSTREATRAGRCQVQYLQSDQRDRREKACSSRGAPQWERRFRAGTCSAPDSRPARKRTRADCCPVQWPGTGWRKRVQAP